MLGAVIAFNQQLQEGLSRDDLRELDQMLERLGENVRASMPRAFP
jgi:hypothetical protein